MKRVLKSRVGVLTAISSAAYYMAAKRSLVQVNGDAFEDPLSSPSISYTTRIYIAIRPILFRLLDPEVAHGLTIKLFSMLGKLPFTASPLPPELSQSLFGLTFPSPFGLSAGFDKNADALAFTASGALQIGHVEIGSVSALPWEGNPKPRLFRLESSHALLNRMGLNNEAAEAVASKLLEISTRVPFGVNLVKTPDPSILEEAAISDFAQSFRLLAPFASWVTLNVSCPNTAEGKTFESAEAIFQLIAMVNAAKEEMNCTVPVFIKLSPFPENPDDLYFENLKKILEMMMRLKVDAVVIANTAADRGADLEISSDRVTTLGKGGISGKPLFSRTRKMVNFVHEATGGKIPIIASGGVFTAEDAFDLMTTGAKVVQLYTAMVYQGPGIFYDLNRGLRRLLILKGKENISLLAN